MKFLVKYKFSLYPINTNNLQFKTHCAYKIHKIITEMIGKRFETNSFEWARLLDKSAPVSGSSSNCSFYAYALCVYVGQYLYVLRLWLVLRTALIQSESPQHTLPASVKSSIIFGRDELHHLRYYRIHLHQKRLLYKAGRSIWSG